MGRGWHGAGVAWQRGGVLVRPEFSARFGSRSTVRMEERAAPLRRVLRASARWRARPHANFRDGEGPPRGEPCRRATTWHVLPLRPALGPLASHSLRELESRAASGAESSQRRGLTAAKNPNRRSHAMARARSLFHCLACARPLIVACSGRHAAAQRQPAAESRQEAYPGTRPRAQAHRRTQASVAAWSRRSA